MIRFLEDTEEPSAESTHVVDWTERIFCPGGYLEKVLGLEHRIQQEEMAIRVAQSMTMDEALLFEAGTGVGKSLAYLIPGLLRAVSTKRPFLVSTHTISLQEQIREKDLEQCRRLFRGVPELGQVADFRFAFLVGRGNYVCHKRLQRAALEGEDLFSKSAGSVLESLMEWSLHTETGLRQEITEALSPELWDSINADSSTCNRKSCPAKSCPYHTAREQVQKSHLILLNHSLLFSLVAAGMSPGGEQPGILYPNDYLVMDEAHTLPSIATHHLGSSISDYGIERALRILYNSKTKKGLLRKIGNPGDWRLVDEAIAGCREFFQQTAAIFLRKKARVRIVEGDWAEPVFQPAMSQLAKRLKALAQKEQDETRADEIRDQQTRVEKYLSLLLRFLEMDFEGEVIWLERAGRRTSILYLQSAPIDLAPALREILFRRNTSSTLTSATLASYRGMEPFLDRIGAEGQEHEQVDSPFDYEKNCRVYIATDGPLASGVTAPATREYWVAAIEALVTSLDGGTLVLFTSYTDMSDVACRLREGLEKKGRPLLEQVPGGNRTRLLEDFRQAGNAVLFGTETFWTGIDVPGKALSQVIITKLPFENPSHPVFQAREENVRARGGQPFYEISLPESILRFRQGIGRLIRKSDDTGRIVILDGKVLFKPYGKFFLQALPTQNYTRFSLPDLKKNNFF